MRHRVLTALAVFILAVTPPPVSAQQPPPPPEDLGALSFQELIDLEVVYAASKTEQKTREAPSSVTIVSREEIRAFGYRSLGEILHGVRGFAVTSDRNYTYVGVRGFARPGDYNSRLLLLVNGARVNENIYGSVLAGRENLVDVEMIERVEIVRGPSSSIYGTNAFFGVINVITRTMPADSPMLVTAEGGSGGAWGGGFAAGGSLGAGTRIDGAASIWNSEGRQLYFPEFDDPSTNDGRTANDDEKAWNLFGALRSGNLFVQAAAVDREKGIPTGAFGTEFDDPRNRTRDALAFAALQWDRAAGTNTAIQARLSAGRYAYDGEYVYDVVNRDESRGTWVNGELLATLHRGTSHTLVVGSEYQADLEQSQRNFDLDPREIYLDREDDSYRWAAFIQDEFRLTSRLRALLGVRYDYDEHFGGEPSPRAALVAALDPRTTVKLLGGWAFRAPNAYEMHYRTESPLQLPNRDLDPESLESFELVVERLVGANAQLTASLFRNDLSDLIELVELEDGALQYRNSGNTRATGAEIELTGKWGPVRARASYAYQDVVDAATDREPSNAPNHLAKSQVAFPVAFGASLGLETLYTGPRTTLSGAEAGGHTVANATLRIPLFSGRSELSASLLNAFDHRYADPASEEHLQDVIERDGRTFRFRLRTTFGR